MSFYAVSQKDTLRAAMIQPESEPELVQRIAAGEESALRELYAAYGQQLYAYALRLVNDPGLAEDAVQNTLITVWRTAAKYRGEGRVKAWLLGIVHNLALKNLRQQHLPISDDLEAALPAPGALPEDQAQRGEQSAWVRDGLQSLSPEHRAVLELVFYQGLSLEEAARVCDCPLGTVKSRLSYARQHLRRILSRQNVEEWR